MRQSIGPLLPLILICGCSSDTSYVEPPPPPSNPAAIDAQTRSLGPTEFIPSIEVKDDQLNVMIRLTFANLMNRRDRDLALYFPIVNIDLLDSRGQPIPSAMATNFQGGAGSIAAHAYIFRTFEHAEQRKDVKQLRVIFDETFNEIHLIWDIQPKLNGGFDLSPASPHTQRFATRGESAPR